MCSRTPTVHITTISRFLYNFFQTWPLILGQHTIHQVIWPSPCTLPGNTKKWTIARSWPKGERYLHPRILGLAARYAIRDTLGKLLNTLIRQYALPSIRSTFEVALRSWPHSALIEPFSVSSLWPKNGSQQKNPKKQEKLHEDSFPSNRRRSSIVFRVLLQQKNKQTKKRKEPQDARVGGSAAVRELEGATPKKQTMYIRVCECLFQNNNHKTKHNNNTNCGSASSQALPGFLITAPPSVCVPDAIGVLAVWIQNQKQKQKNTHSVRHNVWFQGCHNCGRGGCGLGVDTERMTSTHKCIHIYINIFGEYKFYYMCIMYMFLCSGVVRYILKRREGLKVSTWITHRGLGFQTLNYPENLWKNHANMFSDALALVCLFFCWNKDKKTLRLLCWERSSPPGSDHTRAEAQTVSRNIIPAGNVPSIHFFFFGFEFTQISRQLQQDLKSPDVLRHAPSAPSTSGTHTGGVQ